MKYDSKLGTWERNLLFFITLIYALIFIFFENLFVTPAEQLDTTDDLWYDEDVDSDVPIRSK
jgi:hypothetical protein